MPQALTTCLFHLSIYFSTYCKPLVRLWQAQSLSWGSLRTQISGKQSDAQRATNIPSWLVSLPHPRSFLRPGQWMWMHICSSEMSSNYCCYFYEENKLSLLYNKTSCSGKVSREIKIFRQMVNTFGKYSVNQADGFSFVQFLRLFKVLMVTIDFPQWEGGCGWQFFPCLSEPQMFLCSFPPQSHSPGPGLKY